MARELEPQQPVSHVSGDENQQNMSPHERYEHEWRQEFPYPWDEDEIITRRDTLRFFVGCTGALCAATGVLAILGNLPKGDAVKHVFVANVDEIKPNDWRVFDFPDNYSQGIVINLPGKGLVAYSNVCTHLSCAVVYTGDGEHLHCPCHEGLFDVTTGNVLAGPPTRPLSLIQLAIEDGKIYAVRMLER